VATASTSYLQTLPKDEAIAFVASLQTVQDHLSQALQLKGIETLLLEAEALGLVAAETHAILEVTSAVTAATPTLEAAGVTHSDSLESAATAAGSTSIVTATESVAAAIAALPTKKH
jgi:hypothetical protein